MNRDTSAQKTITRPGLPWQIRAVQMDLARQMETVDYICRYVDFAAAQGFNTLVLYLEGRVQTSTFPFRPKGESYSLEDMKRVVDHAAKVGVEVVPVVSVLGHAEHFLTCPEMFHLCEERNGRSRFGGNSPFVFCPSQEETYDFLQKYFSELTQVFTSEHFHLGCDEVWNLGYCDLCQERWKTEGFASLFTKHYQRMEKMCSDLGKRIWIWDDMYEVFPEELENAPRSIIMCHWNYNEIVEQEGSTAHFVNKWRKDWLAEYERLGFDALICPAPGQPRNVVTFTDYARRHKVLGGYLTQWELSVRFHEEYMPATAFTGRLWSQSKFDPERAWKQALQSMFPKSSFSLQSAVRAVVSIPRCLPSPSVQSYLTGPVTVLEHLNELASRNALELLQSASKRYRGDQGKNILTDLDETSRLHLLHLELRDLLPAIYNPRRQAEDVPALKKRVKICLRELDQLIELRAPLHERIRPQMFPEDHGILHLRKVREELEKTFQRLAIKPKKSDWWLVLRLFLPDIYGAPKLKVEALVGNEVISIVEGSFKPPMLSGESYYTLQVPFISSKRPKALRIQVWGYGGQGITFVEVQNMSDTLFPTKIHFTSGPMEHVEAILRDDSCWAYLGNVDITAAMIDPALAEERAVVEVDVQKDT